MKILNLINYNKNRTNNKVRKKNKIIKIMLFNLFFLFGIFFNINILVKNSNAMDFDELLSFYGLDYNPIFIENNISKNDSFENELQNSVNLNFEKNQFGIYNRSFISLNLSGFFNKNQELINETIKFKFFIENIDGEFIGEKIYFDYLKKYYIIEVDIDLFFQSFKNGPYKISVIEIYDNKNNILDSFISDVFSVDLSYIDLERSNLPFLVLENKSYNNSSGNLSFIISNKGDISALFFENKIEYKDYEEYFFIDFLNPNSSKFYTFQLEKNILNISEIKIILDIANNNLQYDNYSFIRRTNFDENKNNYDFVQINESTKIELNQEVNNTQKTLNNNNNNINKNNNLNNVNRNKDFSISGSGSSSTSSIIKTFILNSTNLSESTFTQKELIYLEDNTNEKLNLNLINNFYDFQKSNRSNYLKELNKFVQYQLLIFHFNSELNLTTQYLGSLYNKSNFSQNFDLFSVKVLKSNISSQELINLNKSINVDFNSNSEKKESFLSRVYSFFLKVFNFIVVNFIN